MNVVNFKTYVKQILIRTDKDTEIVQAYNDAIIAVAAKMPHGAYKYQSYLPLVAQQEDYPLPSTIVHLLHPVKLLEGTGTNDSGWPLNRLTKQEYDEEYPNPNRASPSITGVPTDYCIYSGSILIGPLPETGTDDYLEIDWTKVPTDISGDSETPALPDYWREVLRQMVLKRIYEGLELFQEAQYWRSLYEDAEGNPVGQYRDFLNIEKDKEQHAIGKIVNNPL